MRMFVIGGLSFFLSLFLQHIWIKVQRREKFTQAQKSYGVGIDVEIKAATPSMGGVVFLVLGLAAMIAGYSRESLLFWSLPLIAGFIGFADDGLKFLTHTSEGFRSLGKLKVQLVSCAVWTAVVWIDGRLGLWPGLDVPSWLLLPMAFLGSAGMINAVNITDGLDGLAAGCFLISLSAAPLVIPMEGFVSDFAVWLFFMAAGFLFHNIRPAKTFMGDTGSHFLGGALASLCIMNGRMLALLPLGFIFIIELLSSAIQIYTIRRMNKRIFLMAPLHHHFQRMGWDETTVTSRFWLVHAVGAAWLSLLLKCI